MNYFYCDVYRLFTHLPTPNDTPLKVAECRVFNSRVYVFYFINFLYLFPSIHLHFAFFLSNLSNSLRDDPLWHFNLCILGNLFRNSKK